VTLITISGLPGSGTTTASRIVCQELGLEHVYAGMVFRKLAVEKDMTLEAFGRYAEEHPEVDWELDRRMARRAKANDAVLEGRLTGWMAQRESIDALKVWLVCDENERAARVAEREGLTREQALSANRTREQSEWSRYHDIYEIDLKDTAIYDLVIDTGEHPADEVARQIIEGLGKPG